MKTHQLRRLLALGLFVVMMISACGGGQPSGNPNTNANPGASPNPNNSNSAGEVTVVRPDCASAARLQRWIDKQLSPPPGSSANHYTGDLSEHVNAQHSPLEILVLESGANKPFTIEVVGVLRSTPEPVPGPGNPPPHDRHKARKDFEGLIETLTDPVATPCVYNVVYNRPVTDKGDAFIGQYEFNVTSCDWPNVPCDGVCAPSCNRKDRTLDKPVDRHSMDSADKTDRSNSTASDRPNSNR